MRIDRLELSNFKKFAEEAFDFPRPLDSLSNTGSFHVLIGENGSGKTSVLDALFGSCYSKSLRGRLAIALIPTRRYPSVRVLQMV